MEEPGNSLTFLPQFCYMMWTLKEWGTGVNNIQIGYEAGGLGVTVTYDSINKYSSNPFG